MLPINTLKNITFLGLDIDQDVGGPPKAYSEGKLVPTVSWQILPGRLMPSFLTYVKKGRNCFFKFKAGLFFRFPLYFGYDFPSLSLVIITRSGFHIHQGKVTKLSTRKVWSLKSQAHEPNRSEYCSPLETGILCSVELSKWAKVRLSRG